MLVALGEQTPRQVVVNVTCDDGLVREVQADVSRTAIFARSTTSAPPAVAGWMVRFETHERSLVECALSPSAAAVEAAIHLDPLIPAERSKTCVAALQSLLRRRASGG